ncbi:response regulator [Ferroacidibacillus organovorans]|uniref:Transcriptional regulatory protein KdpE n=1 Tax=Ferroacidibacillus organovorans TaxID=1765683 RepID=A0A853KEC6_9BACL|nr:response regulator [Ferroacidibacillus organovorans]KYP81745.1 DNA-binding response regulator [Ferroacidibacillus organovorans]OAG93740.1 two-component system response regulator [Ferroacidibacillus organovorans]
MTAHGARILVIDDEKSIRRLLKVNLQAHGYAMFESESGADGILKASEMRPDLIILDLGLPDVEGHQVLKQIREWSRVPIIVLTVREDVEEKIAALDQGADDFVTKPFALGELLARIRVWLRHIPKQEEPVLTFGDLTVDLAQRLVLHHQQPVKLTPIEYDLLKVLVRHAGRVMTHRQLLQEVWGNYNVDESSHYLRIYIGHLRKKLERDPARPSLILTEPGVGYRFIVAYEEETNAKD